LRLPDGSITLKIMTAKYQTYIGIDVQAVQKPYFYSALNTDLENIACGHGRLGDVLAFLSGQSSALVAVNGPICFQFAADSLVQGGLFEADQTSQHKVNRTGDAELTARGYNPGSAPVSGKKPPLWVERSLELTAGIRQLGYGSFSNPDGSNTFFETQCDAAYWLSTGAMPYDSRSLEGRLQRQLLLCEFGFPLKDPMAFLEEFTRFRLRTTQVPMSYIQPAHELRALMAAATAWLMDVRPEAVEHLGEMNEGEIFLPREFTRK
jgi:hypothetical protein